MIAMLVAMLLKRVYDYVNSKSKEVDAMEELVAFVRKRCPDYPLGNEPTISECLWAIDCAIMGTSDANDDCHRLIRHLGNKLGMSTNEIVDEWESLLASDASKSKPTNSEGK